MKIPFSYIFKNKKFLFSVLLFAVITGIFVPTITEAASWWQGVPNLNTITAKITTIFGCLVAPTGCALAYLTGYSVSSLIIAFLLTIVLTAAFTFSFLSGTLLTWIII